MKFDDPDEQKNMSMQMSRVMDYRTIVQTHVAHQVEADDIIAPRKK